MSGTAGWTGPAGSVDVESASKRLAAVMATIARQRNATRHTITSLLSRYPTRRRSAIQYSIYQRGVYGPGTPARRGTWNRGAGRRWSCLWGFRRISSQVRRGRWRPFRRVDRTGFTYASNADVQVPGASSVYPANGALFDGSHRWYTAHTPRNIQASRIWTSTRLGSRAHSVIRVGTVRVWGSTEPARAPAE